MANKIAMAHGWEDAQTWIDETVRDNDSADALETLRKAIAPGTLGASEALVNALGTAKVAALFGVANESDEFSAALGDYSAEWMRAVSKEIARREASRS